MGQVIHLPQRSRSAPDPTGLIRLTDVPGKTGASYRQVDYWARIGRISQIHCTGEGSGYVRYMPESEIPVVRLAVSLSRALEMHPRKSFEVAREMCAAEGSVSISTPDSATLTLSVSEN